MAKKNKNYYLEVWNGEEWRYITETDWAKRFVKWEKGKQAAGFTKHGAEDIVYCMTLNLYKVRIVFNPFISHEEWHN